MPTPSSNDYLDQLRKLAEATSKAVTQADMEARARVETKPASAPPIIILPKGGNNP